MARPRPQVAATTAVLILFLMAEVVSSGEATTIVLRPPHGGSNSHTMFLSLFLSPPPSSSSGNSSPSVCRQIQGSDPLHPNACMLLYDNLLLNEVSCFDYLINFSIKSLKDVPNSPYAPEFDISGITNPFLHIRLLRFLCILGHGDADASDCMNDILAQDSDASIRKRALELVYLLVNESNVKSLTKELIEYLEVSDQDFKGDLTAKICSIIEKAVATEVCEELFTLIPLYAELALNGVEVFMNTSGSHHQLRKLDLHLHAFIGAAHSHEGVYMYSNHQGCDGGRLYYGK